MNRIVSSILAMSVFAVPAVAESRALLIGIGNYKIKEMALPGIDRDLAAMAVVAGKMGFTPNQIHILRDKDASLTGIVHEIKTWLTQGVGPRDKVLLYYSGHGSSIPDQPPLDEEDGCDEVLVPWDAEFVAGVLKNALVDDDMGDMLAAIPSRNVLVIFDSCNSGTATKGITLTPRSMGDDMRPKAVFFDGFKGAAHPCPNTAGARSSFTPTAANPAIKMNYVGIMAARDDEFANATGAGSILTLALKRVFDAQTKGITPRMLMERATAESEQYAADMRKRGKQVSQHPQLNGDETLYDKPLFGEDAQPPPPPPPPPPPSVSLLQKWEAVVEAIPARLTIKASQSAYTVGQRLAATVQAPGNGYLYLVNVGEGDNDATLLFPNQFDTNNLVSAGQTIQLPSNSKWKVTAGLSDGLTTQKNLLVAFISPDKIDIGDASKGFRPAGIFKQMIGEVPRSFAVEANTDGASRAAGKVYVDIRK